MRFSSCLFLFFLVLSLSQIVHPQCPLQSHYRRTLDGTCNNLEAGSETIGAAESFFKHTKEGFAFENITAGLPVSEGRIGPRQVSLSLLQIGTDPASKTSRNGLSLLTAFFGQFLSHDLILTPRLGEPTVNPTNDSEVTPEIAVIPIHLEQDDPFLFFSFPPFERKPLAPDFIQQRIGRFMVVDGKREFFNSQTSFLDGSAIYYREDSILPLYLDGPKFILQDREVIVEAGGLQGTSITLTSILPTAEIGTPFELSNHLFEPFTEIPVAGDERAAENAALNVIHLLFAREHNRLVDGLAVAHPTWTDEQLFEKARIINVAQLQHITFEEWLPALFGGIQTLLYLHKYRGYKENVDPSISHLFATSAMRFGHTTIPELVPLYGECGQFADSSRGEDGHLISGTQNGIRTTLQQEALAGGVHEIAKSLLYTPLEVFDHLIHDNMRNINIPAPTIAGVDIPAANMNRARWSGVPGWDKVYEAWNGIFPGLKKIYGRRGCTSTPESPAPDDIKCFTSWIDDEELAFRTRETYGKVSHIDPWFAFLVEKKAIGSSLGRTATKVILDQFKRVRDGDRFWYERLPSLPVDPLFGTPPLTLSELDEVKEVKMSDLIKRNFPEIDPSFVQTSAFKVPFQRFFSRNPQCAS